MVNKSQQGFTLVMTLIMMLVMTALIVSAMFVTTINSRITGNMQTQGEATSAAQTAIEQVASGNFWTVPTAQDIPIDIDNDGTTDYTVHIATPTCTSNDPMYTNELDPNDPSQKACLGDTTTSTGVLTSTPVGTSQVWCYKQNWDLKATVDDSATGASVEVHQGVYLQVPAGTTC